MAPPEAPKPFGTWLWHQRKLFWLSTWRELARPRQIDLSPVPWSILAISMSLIASHLLPNLPPRLKLPRSTVSLPFHSLYKSFLVAWITFWSYRARALIPLLRAMRATRKNQSLAFPSAAAELGQRVADGRAYRRADYDVYVPSTPSSTGILFVPGAGVEDVAYAEIVGRLADAGFLTVVVSAEPLRLASVEFGMTPSHLQAILDQVARQHGIGRWVGVGHSMGSFCLAHVAESLGLKQLVFWGVAPFVPSMKDLSSSNIRLLLIQGSQDGIIAMFATKEWTSQYAAMLPPQSTTAVIQGGTHAGFASYRSSFLTEEGGIETARQHEQVAALTVDFVQSYNNT